MVTAMVLASKYAMLMAAAIGVVLAPAVLDHEVLFPILVLGESPDVHEVVVGGGVVLKSDLARALGDLLLAYDLLPKLGLVFLHGQQRHAVAETESIFAHIGVPRHGVAHLQRPTHHAAQLVQRHVEVFPTGEVVRHFQGEARPERVVGKAGDGHVVVGVDAQHVAERLGGVTLVLKR